MRISKNDIALVEKYNGTVPALWMDLWYTHLLNKYVTLLEGDEWDTLEIADTSFIRQILLENKTKQEAIAISCSCPKEPVTYIQDAIRRVCEAAPLYQSYQDENVNPSDIRKGYRGAYRRIFERFHRKPTVKTCEVKQEQEPSTLEIEPTIQPMTFYGMKQPTLFLISMQDLERLMKQSLVLSSELAHNIINHTRQDYSSFQYFDHAIRYIVEDMMTLAAQMQEMDKEYKIDTIERTLDCLSELYSCCVILKEKTRETLDYALIHGTLDKIISAIKPYIKVKDEKMDYEELHRKIALTNLHHSIASDIDKCENPKKLEDIHYIVRMLLREDVREVDDIVEIIRKRRTISKN